MRSGDHSLFFSSSCSDNTKIKIGARKGRVVAGGGQKRLPRCQLLEETRLIRGRKTADVLPEFLWGFGFVPPTPKNNPLISETGMKLQNNSPPGTRGGMRWHGTGYFEMH